MNKKLKFALTTIWILFSRSYDAYCTNLLTPDLSKEANPLVTVVGVSSWTTLLIILGILTIYVIYAYFISVFRPMNLLPKETSPPPLIHKFPFKTPCSIRPSVKSVVSNL